MSVDPTNALLAWYAVDKRALPWRALPGETPDPYAVWLSEIMLQQTTVAAVKPYFAAFLSRWPTVAALAAAGDGDVMSAWAGLGYYARARNLLACARAVVAEHGSVFPGTEAELRRLPGIGDYTAAAIAAIAFGARAVVIDGNVERVVTRLSAVSDPMPGAKRQVRALADRMTPDERAGDFAQAMMDLGATICTPRSPRCDRCPVARWCEARALGTPETYPVKAPKRVKPERRWTGYWLVRDGEVLLVRRPPRGLLGGMLALPVEAPVEAEWRRVGAVSHVFTHFSLTMDVIAADAHSTCHPRESGDPEDSSVGAKLGSRLRGNDREGGSSALAVLDAEWWPVDRIAEAGLPSVFAKAAALFTALPLWRDAA